MATIHAERVIEGRKFMVVETAGTRHAREWGIFKFFRFVEIAADAEYVSVRQRGLIELCPSSEVDARSNGPRSEYARERAAMIDRFNQVVQTAEDAMFAEYVGKTRRELNATPRQANHRL